MKTSLKVGGYVLLALIIFIGTALSQLPVSKFADAGPAGDAKGQSGSTLFLSPGNLIFRFVPALRLLLIDKLADKEDGFVRLQSLEGTAFKGSLSGVVVPAGRPWRLTRVEWDLKPWSLLTQGSLAYDFRVVIGEDAVLTGTIARAFLSAGDIVASPLNGRIKADFFERFFPPLTTDTQGDLAISIDSLELLYPENVPVHWEGQILWSGAVLSSPLSLDAGNIQLKLSLAGGNKANRSLTAELANKEGDIDLKGGIDIDGAGDFSAFLVVNARKNKRLSDRVIASLSFLGEQRVDNSFLINHKGSIPLLLAPEPKTVSSRN